MIHIIRIPYLATFEHASTETASPSIERATTSSPTDTDRSPGKSERFQSTLGLAWTIRYVTRKDVLAAKPSRTGTGFFRSYNRLAPFDIILKATTPCKRGPMTDSVSTTGGWWFWIGGATVENRYGYDESCHELPWAVSAWLANCFRFFGVTSDGGWCPCWSPFS
jgi:hypothetical protein